MRKHGLKAIGTHQQIKEDIQGFLELSMYLAQMQAKVGDIKIQVPDPNHYFD